jgi:hypothetical protein
MYKAAFGRDLYVTQHNEIIRELNQSPRSENQMTFVNSQFNTSRDYYARRISHKPVTGVHFYKKDVEQKEIQKKLAYRRIKMIQTIQYNLPMLGEIKSV